MSFFHQNVPLVYLVKLCGSSILCELCIIFILATTRFHAMHSALYSCCFNSSLESFQILFYDNPNQGSKKDFLGIYIISLVKMSHMQYFIWLLSIRFILNTYWHLILNLPQKTLARTMENEYFVIK